MLLADHIIAKGVEKMPRVQYVDQKVADSIASRLPATTIFDISDVAEYLYAVTDQEEWSLPRDFSCLAPPFPSFWMEYRRPSRINSEVHGVKDTSLWPERTAIYVTAEDAEEVHERVLSLDGIVDYATELAARLQASSTVQALLPDMDRKRAMARDDMEYRFSLTEAQTWTQDVIDELRRIERNGLEEGKRIHDRMVASGVKWYLKCYPFQLAGPRQGVRREAAVGPLARWDISVGADGRVLSDRYNTTPQMLEIGRQDRSSLNGLFYAAFMAIDWLHLKNVATRKVEADPKLQKAYLKRHGERLLRYHVLELEPLKKVLKEYGAHSKGVGFTQALHRVRLHFRLAGVDGRGKLFGRLSGRFMIPAHVRGSSKEGSVVKDYRVKAK